MTAQIDKLYDEAWEFIDSSRKQVQKGKNVQMQPLEGMVAKLCGQIKDMPQAGAQQYETRLQKLIAALVALEKELVAQRDNVQSQLDNLGKSHAANRAYVKSGGLQPTAKPENNDEPEEQ